LKIQIFKIVHMF